MNAQPETTAAPRRYRCTYAPLDRDRLPLPVDTGVLPALSLQARNAEDAQRLAFATIGCPIVLVERLEDVA